MGMYKSPCWSPECIMYNVKVLRVTLWPEAQWILITPNLRIPRDQPFTKKALRAAIT